MADIVIGAVIVALIAAVVVKMRKDKKAGKSSCGCNCAGCSSKGGCNNI